MGENGSRSAGRGGNDPDGVRVVRRDDAGRSRRLLWQALALFLVAGCVGYAMSPSPSAPKRPDRRVEPPMSETDKLALEALVEGEKPIPDDAKADDGDTAPVAATVAGGDRRSLTPRRRATPRAEKPSDLTPEQQQLADKLRAEGRTEVGAGEYIKALNDAGIHEGIGAFNPPGTKPPLEGLAVPDDYELPEGFVRHHQATDDGQSIDPILMFDPTYEFLGPDGNPIELPEDLVVRPEHVPPGFPLRPVEIPPPREPGDVSR